MKRLKGKISDFQMSSLEDVYGPNHNIGNAFSAATMAYFENENRLSIPPFTSRQDVSGTTMSFQEIQEKRESIIEIDEYTLQADTIVNKFKFYKNAYEANLKNIADTKKKLEELEKTKEEYLEYSSVYHNLLLGLLNFPIETFDSLVKKKKKLKELEESMRKEVIENLRGSLRKFENEMENALFNMNKLRECISAGIKAVLPESELKQNLCTICLEKEVDTCVVPCGHTFCEACIVHSMDKGHVSLTQTPVKGDCPTCRFSIEKTIKFYLN